MAGRGRGRGKASMSINVEQLGFGKGEALPGPVLQPPLKYPPLEYKPLSFAMTSKLNYLLEIKRDFADFTRDSAFYVQPVVVQKDIERYSDLFQDMMTDKTTYEQLHDWTKLPTELKPVRRKRKTDITGNKSNTDKKRKDVDVESKLRELEKSENNRANDVDDDDKAEGDDDEEKDAEEQAEDEEEEVDEEMDDGTDYVNNYFDNGEGFDDEDDNLDDGPLY